MYTRQRTAQDEGAFMVSTRGFAVVLSLAAIAATPVAGAQSATTQHCRKTFTVFMVKRAIRAAYSGIRDVTARDSSNLRRYTRCMRNPLVRPEIHRFWHQEIIDWNLRRHPLLSGPVIASWFYDAGGTACGIHATYGFATLLSIPCGSTVTMRGPSGVLIRAVREDSGPYVGGRTFDLNPALRDALGCGGICTIYYHIN